MSAARTLGFIYLVMATVFGFAIALQQHPQWQRSARGAADEFARGVRYASVDVVRPAAERNFVRLTMSLSFRGSSVQIPNRMPREISRRQAPILLAQIFRERAARSVVRAASSRLRSAIFARNSTALPPSPTVNDHLQAASPAFALAEPPSAAAPQSEELAERATRALLPATSLQLVLERLKDNLSPEMLANFDLFLYVSKAERGPWAQHMYVFAKSETGDLSLKYDWLVSTGREKVEFNDAGVRLPSFTPQGYFQLDPDRMYRQYMSSQWHQPMPYAMFFNWLKQGSKTGLAIHAATGEDVGLLGKRASAGCIRLAPENASTLFALVRSRYRGLAPSFAVDRRTGTMSSEGILLHEPDGRLKMAEGYKVLIFIENYGGAENVMAALY